MQVQAEFASGQRSYLKQDDNDAVRQLLLTYLNCRAALLRLAWKYQDVATVRDDALRMRARLLGHAAGVSLIATSLKFVTQFNRSAETVKKFNEAEPLWGIPPNLFNTIQKNLAQSQHRQLLDSALRRHDALQADYARAGFDRAAPHSNFLAAIARGREAIEKLSPQLRDGAVRAVAAEARDVTREAIYQVKSAVSLWVGDTKIRKPRRGRSLIEPAQLAEIRGKLQPGDIVIERRNWFLSNAFLPGYWPHATLYVGTPADIVNLGLDKDPRVAAHWANFTKRDAHGDVHVIIESISEGVVFASLEESIGGGDSCAVMRPRLAPERVRLLQHGQARVHRARVSRV